MWTTNAISNEQEIRKSPWEEAQDVRADGPALLSDEKSGDPFMSFIYEEIWSLSASKRVMIKGAIRQWEEEKIVAALFQIVNFAM